MSDSFLKKIIESDEAAPTDSGFRNFLYGMRTLEVMKEGFESDESVAKELELFIDNSRELYDLILNVKRNLFKHWQKGKYDSQLAMRSWMRIADAGAKQYASEVARSPKMWNEMFPKDIRRMVADNYEEEFHKELQNDEEQVKEEIFNV